MNPFPHPVRLHGVGVGTRAGFGEWLGEQGFSPRTIALYKYLVRRAAVFLRARGQTLGRADLAALHAFWLTVPPSRSSRAGVRYALIAYYRYRGRKDGRPANGLPTLPAPYRLPRPLAEAEYMAFLAAGRTLGGRYKLIAELLGYTGCRFTEMRKAAWHQFDLASDPPVWYIEGKGARKRGAKTRQIPLHPELVATLRAWRVADSHTDVLFPSERFPGRVLCDATIRNHIADIVALSGVEGFQPHRVRHTVATLALAATNDLRGVQELLGHASLASTQIYTGVLPGRLAALIEALPA